jgi:leucine dehydrogenase
VGGANNQLENEKAGDTLFSQGIFYAPDYVVNAGGLISVTDEFEHNTPSTKRIGEKVKRIGETIQRIFRETAQQKIPPNRIADAAAESLLKAHHEY